MKKIVFVLGLVMALSLVGVASAATVSTADIIAALKADPTLLSQIQAALTGTPAATTGSVPSDITKDLSLGSKGEQVESLQQYLIDEGLLEIDAPTGYFGAKTKAAVIQWQKDNDVSPTAGYFGAKSRAKLAELEATAPATVTTPAGTASGTPAVVGMDGADGSINIGVSSIAPTTQTLKKGDTKDIYAIRFSATGGKVNVNRLDVHFSLYPWLVFNTVTLRDASGTVLATKALTSAADVTTVTDGSEYYVRFENLPVVVTPGADTNLVVSVSVPANNSFVGTTGYTSTNVTVPAGAIRTVNGKGIYDSAGLTQTNVVTLSSTGNTSDLSISLAPNSPLNNQVYIPAAGGADTPAVPLAVYRVRSTNQQTTLTTLTFTVNTDTAFGANLSGALKNFQLIDGANKYYGTLSATTQGLVTFTMTNGGIVINQDTNKDLTFAADVVATSTSYAASSTMNISTIVARDLNYNTPTYGGAALTTITSGVVGSNQTFTSSAMTFTGGPTGSPVLNPNGQNASVKATQNYTLNLSNIGSLPLYVSTDAGLMFGTTTSPATNASSSVAILVAPMAMAGDTSLGYMIPAGGSRAFSETNIIGKSSNASAKDVINVTSINYSTAPAGAYSLQITNNLTPLSSAVVW